MAKCVKMLDDLNSQINSEPDTPANTPACFRCYKGYECVDCSKVDLCNVYECSKCGLFDDCMYR